MARPQIVVKPEVITMLAISICWELRLRDRTLSTVALLLFRYVASVVSELLSQTELLKLPLSVPDQTRLQARRIVKLIAFPIRTPLP